MSDYMDCPLCKEGLHPHDDLDEDDRYDPIGPNYGIYLEDARMGVVEALSKLRYSGSVALPPNTEARSETEFLDQTSQWLTAFGKVLAAASDTTTEMARELTDLRSQRKAIRDFLGLGETQ